MEHHNIVIVGGGICGLATALALHRKGIHALVLEKSDILRASGAAIGIFINGWRALDQLGVGTELRTKAIPIVEMQDAVLNKSEVRVTPCRNEEVRCLKRSDLMEALAKELPAHSIRFSCKIVAIESDPVTSFPVIHIDDGSKIKAKVLIGCDGSNSLVAKSIGLKAPKLFPLVSLRGFTEYPNGHNFGSSFYRIRGRGVSYGRTPVDDKSVYWFVGTPNRSQVVENDPRLHRDLTLEMLSEFPTEIADMIRYCDLDSLSLTRIRYIHPWDLLTENFVKGRITVAGDAMHVMGPFLGQGGSAAMEDAVVLARCLARDRDFDRVESVLREYVTERRMRVFKLAAQAYLVGRIVTSASRIVKMVSLVILLVFFNGMSLGHTKYDCGSL